MLHKEQSWLHIYTSQLMPQIQHKYQIPITNNQKVLTEMLISGTINEALDRGILFTVTHYALKKPKVHLKVDGSAFILFYSYVIMF